MPEELKNLAAIDLGTNSFHLVIAEVNLSTAGSGYWQRIRKLYGSVPDHRI